jgi:hypothetical protein
MFGIGALPGFSSLREPPRVAQPGGPRRRRAVHKLVVNKFYVGEI